MSGNHLESVAVVGGGVSGIAAAHYLLKQGYSVDLYEASDQLGGRMCIDQLGGSELCFGGKNIGYQYTEFREFLASYGQPAYEYFGINSARLVNGRPKLFNSKKKLRSLMTLAQTSHFSDLMKFRHCLKAVRSDRSNGDLSSPFFKLLSDQNGSRLTDYFSSKFTQGFLRALTVRMNGAEPHHISLENLGTHLQMLQDKYDQLTSPLRPILESFEKTTGLTVHLNTPVIKLNYLQGRFELKTAKVLRFYDRVVVALPAYAASKLLAQACPDISALLKRVRYFPVGVIVADYANDVFHPRMRALTFGPYSAISNIGAYGIHALDKVRYTFSGEAAEDVLHEALNDAHLLNMAEAQAAPFFNLKDNRCRAYKVKYWNQGLCAYTQDEFRFQSDLAASLKASPGLFLAGDYRKGASIENCFRASKATVEDFIQMPSQNQPKFHYSPNIKTTGSLHV